MIFESRLWRNTLWFEYFLDFDLRGLLLTKFIVIVTQVASLAYTASIEFAVSVLAQLGHLETSLRMVAIFTHACGIIVIVDMLTLCDCLAMLDSTLIGLWSSFCRRRRRHDRFVLNLNSLSFSFANRLRFLLSFDFVYQSCFFVYRSMIIYFIDSGLSPRSPTYNWFLQIAFSWRWHNYSLGI